jgi:1-deoxy-D-xylulose-5-phosphate reductoisomerase
MKNLYILGAGGSIGRQTLEVIKDDANFNLIGVSLSRKDEVNYQILDNFKMELAVLRDENNLLDYQKKYPDIKFLQGDLGLIELLKYHKPGLVVNALSGASGLIPTIEIIKAKKDLALANKESLVMAGEIVMNLARKHKVKIIPIDSEHNAIYNLLKKIDLTEIKKIIITASGGSLRDYQRDQLKDVTVSQVLNHPNWIMGPKITVDSTTMMNKGLEVIEAHYLFNLPYDKIETILHKESLVHGMIVLNNGEVKAFSALNDMKLPIKNALYYGDYAYQSEIDLDVLSFREMDFKRFPLLKLSYEVAKEGGLMPTVLNAANEAAVKLFLEEKIAFSEIEDIIFKTVKDFKNILNPSLEDIVKTNQVIQTKILKEYSR